MTKTMKIEGMMCGHCEARVKKVLEALPEVDAAEVSHEAGTAVVTMNAEVSDDVLTRCWRSSDQQFDMTLCGSRCGSSPPDCRFWCATKCIDLYRGRM